MEERLDKILEQLIAQTEKATETIIQKGFFAKDDIEAICIVLSMAYGRFVNGNK